MCLYLLFLNWVNVLCTTSKYSKKKNEAPYLGQWYILEINRKIVYPLMKEMVINSSSKEREKGIIWVSRGLLL